MFVWRYIRGNKVSEEPQSDSDDNEDNILFASAKHEYEETNSEIQVEVKHEDEADTESAKPSEENRHSPQEVKENLFIKNLLSKPKKEELKGNLHISNLLEKDKKHQEEKEKSDPDTLSSPAFAHNIIDKPVSIVKSETKTREITQKSEEQNDVEIQRSKNNFTEEQFQAFMNTLVMCPPLQADHCHWHQEMPNLETSEDEESSEKRKYDLTEPVTSDEDEDEDDDESTNDLETSDTDEEEENTDSEDSDEKDRDSHDQTFEQVKQDFVCQVVEHDDGQKEEESLDDETSGDEAEEKDKPCETDTMVKNSRLHDDRSLTDDSDDTNSDEEHYSSEWDVWSESTSDSKSSFGEFVRRTITKDGKKRSEFVNLFFDINSIEVMGIDKDAGPLEEYFKTRYRQLCLKSRCAFFRLGEILCGYDPRAMPQFITVTITNWSDQKFSIPFNTSFLYDYFPGEHTYFFQEGNVDELPDEILLLFREQGKVVKRDYTKQLQPYAWDMFRCGSSFRPHAWEWLRVFSDDPEACLFMTRKDDEDQVSHATFTFWPPKTSDRWEKRLITQ